MGLIPRSERIVKEEHNESNYFQPDNVGGGNSHLVVGGNEHAGQRTRTATKPKAERSK